MKKLLIIILLLTLSCNRKKPTKGYVDEKFAIEHIKEDMTREEVIQTIGMPKDSSEYHNYANEYLKLYMYETNNFSGYRLKVVMDENNKVTHFYFD